MCLQDPADSKQDHVTSKSTRITVTSEDSEKCMIGPHQNRQARNALTTCAYVTAVLCYDIVLKWSIETKKMFKVCIDMKSASLERHPILNHTYTRAFPGLSRDYYELDFLKWWVGVPVDTLAWNWDADRTMTNRQTKTAHLPTSSLWVALKRLGYTCPSHFAMKTHPTGMQYIRLADCVSHQKIQWFI